MPPGLHHGYNVKVVFDPLSGITLGFENSHAVYNAGGELRLAEGGQL
jgi:hypothetical protein